MSVMTDFIKGLLEHESQSIAEELETIGYSDAHSLIHTFKDEIYGAVFYIMVSGERAQGWMILDRENAIVQIPGFYSSARELHQRMVQRLEKELGMKTKCAEALPGEGE